MKCPSIRRIPFMTTKPVYDVYCVFCRTAKFRERFSRRQPGPIQREVLKEKAWPNSERGSQGESLA
jgi:hypothetical protein